MAQRPTLDTWRTCLERQGHRVQETVTGFTLWPHPEIIITVAVEPDPTLYPHRRQRFFLCQPESEQVFRVLGCPEPHRTRWLELVSQQAPGYWQDFLAGPGSWLLSRLARFSRIVAWSDRGLPWNELDCPIHRNGGMAVPAAAAPLFAPAAGPEAARHRLLSASDERFTDAVAACVLFASPGMRDCYLADADATEVYLAHHHEKVVVSIPEVEARRKLLQELEEAAWLFTLSKEDDHEEPDT